MMSQDMLAIEGKAYNQCTECFSYRADGSIIQHLMHCSQATNRVYTYEEAEKRADIFLRMENAGISSEWYE